VLSVVLNKECKSYFAKKKGSKTIHLLFNPSVSSRLDPSQRLNVGQGLPYHYLLPTYNAMGEARRIEEASTTIDAQSYHNKNRLTY
jgi:hypothetical protein